MPGAARNSLTRGLTAVPGARFMCAVRSTSSDKGTPAARPVRKARDLPETARPPKTRDAARHGCAPSTPVQVLPIVQQRRNAGRVENSLGKIGGNLNHERTPVTACPTTRNKTRTRGPKPRN